MAPPSLLSSGCRFPFVRTALLFLCILRDVQYGHGVTIDTPNHLSECEMVKLTWHDGSPPFTLHIVYTNNSLIQEFSNLNNSTLDWQANITAGNKLYLEVFDHSDGPSSFSGTFTIEPGSDACIRSSTSSGTSTGTGGPPSTSLFASSSTPLPTGTSVLSGPPDKPSTGTLSTAAIAGIAVASLVAGLLIAVGVWLVRRRNSSSIRPRIPNQQHLDTYHYSGPPQSDDGWSVTTPRDPEDGPHSQQGGAKADISWDPRLSAPENTSSPYPPMEHPVVTRQVIHPGIARPLSSYPPLIPTPSPIPMSARESGMWVDSGSGTSLSRSSTNPFRARMLAAAASSEMARAGVNGSNW